MKLHQTVILLIVGSLLGGFLMVSQGFSAESGPGANTIESVEERRLKSSIIKKREQLEAQEAELHQKEIELKTLSAEVDKKLEELRRMGEEMQVLFDQVGKEEQQRLRKLSAMYEKMEPLQAARILVGLKEELVIQILSGMKGKSGGRILANMDRDKAVRLTSEFSQVVSNY